MELVAERAGACSVRSRHYVVTGAATVTNAAGTVVSRLPLVNNKEETEVRHLEAGTGEKKKTLHCVLVSHPIPDVTKMEETAKAREGTGTIHG